MIDRRDFLTTTISPLFLGGVAPAILGAQDKAGTRPVVIGQGDYQFECNHNWCKVPKHITWKNTQGVTLDQDGFVYIIHEGDAKQPCDTVAVFDPAGDFVRSFGHEFAGGGHGIEYRREEDGDVLYICDTLNRQLVKCDTFGEWIWKQRYPRSAKLYDQLDQFAPTNVGFGPAGELFISDGSGADFIHQYDASGTYTRSFGGNGKLAGQFQSPHGLHLDSRGEEPQICVCDRGNSRLQFLTLDGTPRRVIQGIDDTTKDGEPETLYTARAEEVPMLLRYGLSKPSNCDFWEELMVIADLDSQLLLFNDFSLVVASLGGDAEWRNQVRADQNLRKQPDKWEPGQFIHPHDAGFDADGNLFVVEWVEPGRITKLTWV